LLKNFCEKKLPHFHSPPSVENQKNRHSIFITTYNNSKTTLWIIFRHGGLFAVVFLSAAGIYCPVISWYKALIPVSSFFSLILYSLILIPILYPIELLGAFLLVPVSGYLQWYAQKQ